MIPPSPRYCPYYIPTVLQPLESVPPPPSIRWSDEEEPPANPSCAQQGWEKWVKKLQEKHQKTFKSQRRWRGRSVQALRVPAAVPGPVSPAALPHLPRAPHHPPRAAPAAWQQSWPPAPHSPALPQGNDLLKKSLEPIPVSICMKATKSVTNRADSSERSCVNLLNIYSKATNLPGGGEVVGGIHHCLVWYTDSWHREAHSGQTAIKW